MKTRKELTAEVDNSRSTTKELTAPGSDLLLLIRGDPRKSVARFQPVAVHGMKNV